MAGTPIFNMLPQGTGNRVVRDVGVPLSGMPGLHSMTIDAKTDLATIKLPLEMVERAAEAVRFQDNAMVAMQQNLDQIQMREDAARRQSPVLSAIAAVARHLGNQPDMPGFVRGLAGASEELNPSADALAQRKLPLLMEISRLAQQKDAAELQRAQVMGGLINTSEAIEGRKQNAEQLAWEKAERNKILQGQKVLDAIEAGETSPAVFARLDPAAANDKVLMDSYVKRGRFRADELATERRYKNAQTAAYTDRARAQAASARTEAVIKRAKLPYETARLVSDIAQASAAAYASEESIALRAAELAEKVAEARTANTFRKADLLLKIYDGVVATDEQKEALAALVGGARPPDAPKVGAPLVNDARAATRGSGSGAQAAAIASVDRERATIGRAPSAQERQAQRNTIEPLDLPDAFRALPTEDQEAYFKGARDNPGRRVKLPGGMGLVYDSARRQFVTVPLQGRRG